MSMEIERAGCITLYQFNWVEHVIANAVLKHLDRQRRSGITDALPIHSATRAIFTDAVPNDDSVSRVRWILDEDEYLGSSPDETCAAPDPQTLADLMEYAITDINDGDSTALARPIGRLTLLQEGCSSNTTYRDEPLADLVTQIEQFSNILQNR